MIKGSLGSIILVFLVLTAGAYGQKADIWGIEEVRSKGVLEESDFKIIDNFVRASIKGLVEVEDFTDVARIRDKIIFYSSSETSSSKAQYRRQYYKSAHQYISSALTWAEQLPDENKKLVKIINLLILVDGLSDIQLAELAEDRVNDENMSIRYWAVHSLCSRKVIGQINSAGGENEDLVNRIFDKFEKIIYESDSLIVAMITRFSSRIESEKATELLLKIADMRIKAYADWTVENELFDAVVLRALYRRAVRSPASSGDVAERFGQLYSYVLQRYIKGEERLSDGRKQQLISVMVEIESDCISKLFGRQSRIRRAIEEKDFEKLIKEHNLLLGDSQREGKLGLKFNFMYKRSDGSSSMEPAALSLPSG